MTKTKAESLSPSKYRVSAVMSFHSELDTSYEWASLVSLKTASPVRVRLGTLRLRNPGRFLALSSSSNLSLILSSWTDAHQISWLPFIALSLIGIILGEEIAVSHPISLTARGTG